MEGGGCKRGGVHDVGPVQNKGSPRGPDLRGSRLCELQLSRLRPPKRPQQRLRHQME